MFCHARNGLDTQHWAHELSASSGDAADLGPYPKGPCPESSILGGWDVIAAKMEEVVDLVVGGQEPLRLSG